MAKYSENGYLVAVSQRSARTLLVEGTTDQIIISRVVREIEPTRVDRSVTFVIDSVDLVQGTVPGKREIVEAVHALAVSTGVPLAALVDREFREFDFTGLTVKDLVAAHQVILPDMYWTRGHSIENYFLDPRFIESFLKFQYAEVSTEALILAVANHFTSIVLEASAASLAAYESGLLSRTGSICKMSHWTRVNKKPKINESDLALEFTRRGAQAAQTATFVARMPFYRGVLPASPSLCQWLAHGHFGRDLTWTGVASIAAEHGCSAATTELMGYGHKEAKLRHDADLWAKLIVASAVESPDQLWSWFGFYRT